MSFKTTCLTLLENVVFAIDTSMDGIGRNYPSSYYSFDFGDGTAGDIVYFTHAELMSSNIEISHQAREILVGKIDASEIIFDKENVLNDQINGVQNKLEVEFQLGKLIALVENKMALLGIKKLDDKSGRFQTPLDFIKNISKI